MLLLDAIKGRNKARAPLWMMRQAGRYLPEYQDIRRRNSFLKMCRTPEIAKEVTLTPFKRFSFDAMILFSDILMLPDAYHLGLSFEEGIGPRFSKKWTLEELPSIDPKSSLSFIPKTIALLKKESSLPLIGFAGAPFTVASYMIECGSTKDYIETKRWLYGKKKEMHKLLEKITLDTIAYLKMQEEAGVDLLQLFESSLFTLGKSEADEFSFPYLKAIVDAIKPSPLLIYAKGSALFINELASLGSRGLSVDWQTDIKALRRDHPDLLIQGNLDPALLFNRPSIVKEAMKELIKTMKSDPAYICNLGHGILPNTPLESVQAAIEAVQCSK